MFVTVMQTRASIRCTREDGRDRPGIHRVGSSGAAALRYESSHSGGLPVDRQIETTADELAFLAWQTGIQ